MKCRGRESYDAHQVVPSAVRSSWLQIVGRSAALVLLLASALASLSTAQRKPMPRVELEDSDVILRRQEWFYRQRTRSEEHTSELQSLAYLVCRLLLEKKNILAKPTTDRSSFT